MSETLQVTLLGLIVVFSVLTILAILFVLMGKFLSKDKKEPGEISKKKSEKKTAVDESEKKDVKRSGELTSRMVAVITSAVAQYMGHGDFVIKSVKNEKTASRWKQRKPLTFWKTGRQSDATNLQSNRGWQRIHR
ncbi:MAG: OadG family protein [Kosmotogaceae bacterium]